MNEGKKMLGFAAGLLLAIMIIVIGVSIFNKGKTSVTASSSKYDEIASQFGDAQLSMFDNGSASGSDVLDLITKLNSSSGYSVTVTNGKDNTVVFTYTGAVFGDIGTKEDLADAITDVKKKTGAYYINPNATFTSEIGRDANGVVTSVKFQQVK